MSLYNEVRPKSLSEVKGQESIKQQLGAMFASKNVPNAMLFIGPRGTGKTTVARIVSRYVNCEKGEAEPCGECKTCKSILNGSYMDVVELDAASHNGVSDVHHIIEQAQFSSVGKYRVFILDEVHMFSDNAWNALLKTLEEPPKGVIFILCTTEEHKVPATIISRCRKFHFEKIDLSVIVDSMKEICDKYGKAYEQDALMLIARASDGCMRDALSILESFFDVDGLCVDTVIDTLGSSREDTVFDILSGISEGNVSKALDSLRESDKRGVSLKSLVKSVMCAVTDTMYLLQGADISVIANSEGYKARLLQFKEIADMEHMLCLARKLSECYATISRVDDAEFLVESAIVDAISEESRICVLEKKVAELEKRPVQSVTVPVSDVKTIPSDAEPEVADTAQKAAPSQTEARAEKPQPVQTKAQTQAEKPVSSVDMDGFGYYEDEECPFVDGYQSLFEDDVVELHDDEAPSVQPSNITAFNKPSPAPVAEVPEDIPFEEDAPAPVTLNVKPLNVAKLPAGTAIAGTISLSSLSEKVEQKEKLAAGAEDAGTAPAPVKKNVLPFGPGGFSGLLR